MKEEYNELLAKIKENSIGVEKISEYKPIKKKIDVKTLMLLLSLVISISLTGCKLDIKNNNINENQIVVESSYDDLNISGFKAMEMSIADNHLLFAQIKYKDENGNIISNDKEVYKRLEGLDESKLFGFYLLLGEKESEKILPIYGYNTWDEYLMKNGFINDKGETDLKMWEESHYKAQEEVNSYGRMK